MQRPDGGFALFDRAAATAPWLRHLASALLTHTLSDESSPEVTGRLLSATATRPLLADVRDRAVGFLGRSQGSDGAWTSPFSVGCLPATSSALAGLGAVGQGFRSPARRALAFLLERQGSDGGWGESPRSLGQNYVDLGRSLPSLTGRAVNALLSLRDPAARDAVERGVWYLVRTQEPDGSWQEDDPTAACLSEVLYVRNPVESLVRPLVALQAFLATDQVSSRLGGIARPVESSPDRLGQ
jgi:squalene-hopene/tetraprenyl-beta-curcumene cyclase